MLYVVGLCICSNTWLVLCTALLIGSYSFDPSWDDPPNKPPPGSGDVMQYLGYCKACRGWG